ncbi:MAG: LeuA family protein [Jatrophihabitans sp.]
MTPQPAPARRRLSVFDTTLRDGEQAPGNAMSPEQKLQVALALESMGVDVIESGFPSSSPRDVEATRLIAQALTTAKLATLNRADHADIAIAAEAGGVERHQLQLMATGSAVHLEHKRGITAAEGVAEIVSSIRFARSLGFRDVSLGIEDASRGSDDYLRALIEASLAEGATSVVAADTVGHMIPAEYGAMMSKIRGWVGPDLKLGTHCHHDMGLSLANVLSAIEAGVDEVQTTIAGIGERAGNTPLEELAAVLHYKGEHYGVRLELRTEQLYPIFVMLMDFIGLPQPRNKAIFGVNAFATQAGIHQAGMLRAPITYEYVEPERFGRHREMLVGRHSGRNVVRYVLQQEDLPVTDEFVDVLYEQFVADRSNGECVTLTELGEIARQQLSRPTLAGAPR